MCGIIGYIGSQDPKDILLDGLKRLEYRGYDSAGIALMNRDRVSICRSEGRIDRLEEKLRTAGISGNLGIGHTRWATHGVPSEVNAHPHRVGSVTLVHNGIIENYLELKKELLALGKNVKSDTDTEIVAHLFDIEVEKGKTLAQALPAVLPRLRGSYAFVILNDREPDEMLSVQNGAPLIVGMGSKETFVASDVIAILHRTNKIVYLEDKQYAVFSREGIKIMDTLGNAVDYKVKAIQWVPEQLEMSGHRHYMHKEIHEQTHAIAKTIGMNLNIEQGLLSLKDLNHVPTFLKDIRRVSIVACGTARHAGMVAKSYFERFARVPVEVDYASEFRYRQPVIDKETLLILISQSGETADTLAAQREGAQSGLRTLSICNVRDSSLARASDITLYTGAGPEIGVASTKAFTTQLTLLYMLALELGFKNGTLNDRQMAELTGDLLELPLLVEQTLQIESQMEKIAYELQPSTFFFFLGRDVNHPIAVEGALKLKEISYIHCEGIPAGEIKHGPLALVDRKTAAVILVPQDRASRLTEGGPFEEMSKVIADKMMSNLQEIKSRGARILTVGTENDERFEQGTGSLHVALPSAPWAMNPILMSIPIQLLAYHIAIQRGTDVDKPRNLAKSVTVE